MRVGIVRSDLSKFNRIYSSDKENCTNLIMELNMSVQDVTSSAFDQTKFLD